MARSKSTFQINAEYALVWPLWQAFRMMPRSWTFRISRTILKILLHLIPKRRQMMLANIARAFPTRTGNEHRAIASDSLDNIAKGIAVFVHMPALLNQKDLSWVHYLGAERLAEALAKGKGVIAFNAHFGCWEMTGSLVMRETGHAAAIIRPLDNPKLNALVSRQRCYGAGTLMDRRRLIREGLPFLRRNGILGIMIDQNFPGGGVFVEFLGRLAATTPIVSLMARRTGAAVFPMHSWWEEDQLFMRWDARFELSQNPNAQLAIAEDTQRMTKVVEGWIRERPGQWLWLHNRWKKQPEESDLIYLDPRA